MKPNHILTFTAALSLACCAPALLSAQNTPNSPGDYNSPATASAAQNSTRTRMAQNNQQNSQQTSAEANEMVPARAGLVQTIDANNAKPGQEFKAKLPGKVHLKDGTDLPRGTMLIGKVGQDDSNVQGRSKLVLCIDKAQLKDGKTVPVKATIVGIYRPGLQQSENYSTAAGDQVPNDWHSGIMKVDQIDALHNVDLHSSLNSKNSGVLVSKNSNDIKLKPGTELALAIAGENGQQNMDNSGSSGPGSH